MGIIYKNGIAYGNQPNGTVPSGGTTGQVLKKVSNTDYDTEWANESGGGGTSDYTQLTNKPQINSVTLTGNKSLSDIGAASQSDLEDLEDITGDGQLSGFTATDLTGAANELKNTLNSEIATRQTYVRPNLLDNWYFVYGKAINNDYSSNGTFPVNQRGQQTYSGSSYEIDRWKWWTANLMSISNDGTGVSLNGFLWQTLEESVSNSLLGKTVTISCLFNNGSLISTSGVWATNVLEVSYGDVKILAGAAAAGFAINDPSFIITTQSSQIIQAVKLELGSGQTLAHQENGAWVLNEIPDYGEQLLKCQRYLQVLKLNIRLRSANRFTSGGKTIIDFYYRLCPEMYNIPSFSNATWKMSTYGASGDVASEYSYSTANTKKAILNIRAQKSSDDGLTDAQLYSSTDVYISCEP